MQKAKLRHVAIKSDDVEKEAEFLRNAFGLDEVGRAGAGAIYLSDGVINVAVINIPESMRDFPNFKPDGFNHIGFVVEDLDVAIDQAAAVGAVPTVDRDHSDAGPTWEMKMRSPSGLNFDLSPHGWPGVTV